ncbi:piggyBac transposable element-derived protein 4-like [Maniola hyperantus]|uniref:piggyBac transposable element-derived protein 4-like n=1 Tax=Aphantopus hyperantus TaxID=2795564 RepID=UPI00156A0BF9|nr:piggyBac transposable element-derived protein 4-like [Maniola hyperantus]
MARPRASDLLCFEDSDIDGEPIENEMQEVFSEMRQIVEAQDEEQEIIEEVLPPRMSVPSRDRSRARSRRGSPSRGRAQTATEPTPSLQEMDDANVWTFAAREEPLNNPVFESQTGVRAPVDQTSSQYDCLQLFFNDSFWLLVKSETNRYALQMKAKLANRGQLKPGSMLASWKPVTLSELKLFFSIVIHMTLVHKDTFNSYWSAKSILHTPFASQTMKRDRFQAIYSCLHLNEITNSEQRGDENYDAFFKLKPYFDELCQLFEAFYLPSENLTIDERTYNFRGRVQCRVFNKHKLDKNGMKMYMLCDAETGYLLRMIPYLGDSRPVEEIVMSLTEPYSGKWHTVYMYRFNTNPTIVDSLWTRHTRAVGTVALDRRGVPKKWRRRLLEANEMAFCHRGNLTACKWKDKGFLTTKHAATWTEVEVKAKGAKIKRIKPDCVLDYNVNKIEVNLNHQYVSNYSLKKKSMKWWKNMFFHLVVRAMVNAYIIYYKIKEPERRRKGFANFLTHCGEAMAQDGGYAEEEQRSAGPHTSGTVARLIGRHFIEQIPPTKKKKWACKTCKVCVDITYKRTGQKGRTGTRYYCPKCNVGLCRYPCFTLYHTKKDYTS